MNFENFTMAIHFYHLYIKQKITINIMYSLNTIFNTLLKKMDTYNIFFKLFQSYEPIIS